MASGWRPGSIGGLEASEIRVNGDWAINHRSPTRRTDDLTVGIVLRPSTSGGLLAAVASEAVETLLAQGFWQVGTVGAGEPGITLR